MTDDDTNHLKRHKKFVLPTLTGRVRVCVWLSCDASVPRCVAYSSRPSSLSRPPLHTHDPCRRHAPVIMHAAVSVVTTCSSTGTPPRSSCSARRALLTSPRAFAWWLLQPVVQHQPRRLLLPAAPHGRGPRHRGTGRAGARRGTTGRPRHRSHEDRSKHVIEDDVLVSVLYVV